MAAQTPATALDSGSGQIMLNAGAPAALASVPNPQALDLLQIVGAGGAVIVNVSSTGVVTKSPGSPTKNSLFPRTYTRLTAASTIAQIFADAFQFNANQSDILQVRSLGEGGVWHLDYTGTAFSS